MKRLLPLLLCVGVLLGSIVGSAFAQEPPRAELEAIVFSVATPVDIDEARAAEPNAWLEQEVQQFMDAGRLAPLYLKVGQYPTAVRVFTDPEETFLALSLAYPFLSAGLQEQVKDYLDREYNDYPPHKTAHYPMDAPDFTRRESYMLPDNKKTSEGYYLREGHSVGSLYALWAYAYYTESWDRVSADWQEIRAIFDDFVGTWNCPTEDEDVNQNRYLAGLIGYIRLAHELGATTEIERGLDELERLVPARLANARWRGERAEYYTSHYGNPGDDGPQYDGEQWKGMYKEVAIRTFKIPQYWDLTPELGRLLDTYARAETESSIDHTREVLSSWYIVHNENPVHTNEKHIELPDNVLALFLMMAHVADPGGDTLRLYSSAPLSIGDLHHIQKLVLTVQAYGDRCYEDLRTVGVECSSQGKSVSRFDAEYGNSLTYEITLLGTGRPITLTDDFPEAIDYLPGSVQVTPDFGALSVDPDGLRWTGVLTRQVPLEVTYGAIVTATTPFVIENTARVDDGESIVEYSTTIIANGTHVFLPVVVSDHSPMRGLAQASLAPPSAEREDSTVMPAPPAIAFAEDTGRSRYPKPPAMTMTVAFSALLLLLGLLLGARARRDPQNSSRLEQFTRGPSAHLASSRSWRWWQRQRRRRETNEKQ